MPGSVHATCVALRHRRTWHAVLLRGPSGAGKSDLALRLMEAGARLVADDRTTLDRAGNAVMASAPASIAGLLEVRGLGIRRLPRNQLLAQAAVVLLVDLVPPDAIERLPEPEHEALLGIDLPVLKLAAFEASSCAKLRLAVAMRV
ncbi:HPr kinase/phosphorylase [Reyranella sp.]|uniref:HPr kinase/phosphorylase n=1 Tax=Reyranella sp. TaxID=1929291 RepID=UPI003784A25F